MSGSEPHPTDDGLAVSWLMDLLVSAGDIYVRPLANGPSIETRLREDLGLDSIGLVSVFYAVGDELGIDGDERAVAEWKTVGDVLRYARTKGEASR